ncbi:hypothetical protein [Sandaracinobacteroides hominis]|uniref:hypothetical protein n=1 Tax=Sandaracinobacteroides hominis TaxID=2780086 RepID=UPI0018F705DD|nr:hypothetical protein [Sandaracinobacteroides hominis]
MKRALVPLVPLLALAIAPIGDFEYFYGNFARAVVLGEAARIADLTRTPFLFEGRSLDRPSFEGAVPRLFDAPTRACFRTAKVVTQGTQKMVFCNGSIYVFAEISKGEWRFTEIGVDD